VLKRVLNNSKPIFSKKFRSLIAYSAIKKGYKEMMDLKRVNEYMKRVEESETKTFEPVGRKLKVGLDLGTAYIVLVVLDEKNNPIACEKKPASVLRDGIVYDYIGALNIVRELKEKLEIRLNGRELINCAIAMPAGTQSSIKTHSYIAEGVGFEVTNILDEPTAANSVYQIENGVVVDIGGGTTGLAILKEKEVVQIEDEATGGTHLSLVLSGNYHISFEEAEQLKQNYKKHKEILPVVKPVVEKMASIVKKYVNPKELDTIYLCGGTCCLTGIEKIFETETGLTTIKPDNPFLVTPAGIAMNCKAN
jgi:ethanolamine utilization protein EutJ